MATISPSGIASACSNDQMLELTCSTEGTFLKWSINLTSSNESVNAREISRTLTGSSNERQQTTETVNAINFTFFRSSKSGQMPLMSRLLISPVTNDLNGTEVECTDLRSDNSSSAYTTINIIEGPDLLLHGTVSKKTKHIMSPRIMLM